ncbi:hypothetical protein RP20_CCG004538 [Aedes albopictus]|nr:hypothetical protein RP20_CCG004538 [Aedes albopictus]
MTIRWTSPDSYRRMGFPGSRRSLTGRGYSLGFTGINRTLERSPLTEDFHGDSVVC